MWYTPGQLVATGLDASPLLVANEGHNGLSRCVRARVIGIRMVQAAHDQLKLATAAVGPGDRPNIGLTAAPTRTLDELGGTAGFTGHDPPAGVMIMPGYDAFLLSTDNTMVGEPQSPATDPR
jgi:hypothetical protein